jgi:DNA-binding transcriptional MerR regulator
MEEIRYMISEASKRVEVEDHVLRYWEEQLKLPVSRNELGHRYYKDSDIELLKAIKKLKDQGFQLKAIKMLLPNLNKPENMDAQAMVKLKDELNTIMPDMHGEDEVNNISADNDTGEEMNLPVGKEEHKLKDASEKMGQFKAIMHQIIMSALKDNNAVLSDDITTNVTNGIIKEMNFLMRIQEEKEEERFRKFDITLREYQKSRLSAAAALEGRKRKKSKFMKKNKIYI